jgi:hypothetical protein
MEWVKNGAAAFLTLSTAGYACGYLALRARARVLGIDSGFVLIDQAYIFAGFRFLCSILFALLVVFPLLVAIRIFGRFASCTIPQKYSSVLEIVTALAVGVATVWAYDAVFRPSGVLLGRSAGWVADAAAQLNDYGVLMWFGTIALVVSLLWWTGTHFIRVSKIDFFGAYITLSTTLLIILLPIQYGIFFADRTARRLERVPEGVDGVVSPIWEIEQGSGDKAILFARSVDGAARLLSVKADKLDGIAVVGVTDLNELLGSRP